MLLEDVIKKQWTISQSSKIWFDLYNEKCIKNKSPLDKVTPCGFCWSKCYHDCDVNTVRVCVRLKKKKNPTGHPGHEQPEALYPSGRNEPLRSVPLLPFPAELRERRRAAAERSSRTQRPSWSLQHHPCAGGVPQRAGCDHGTVKRASMSVPLCCHCGLRNSTGALCEYYQCSEAVWPAGGSVEMKCGQSVDIPTVHYLSLWILDCSFRMSVKHPIK